MTAMMVMAITIDIVSLLHLLIHVKMTTMTTTVITAAVEDMMIIVIAIGYHQAITTQATITVIMIMAAIIAHQHLQDIHTVVLKRVAQDSRHVTRGVAGFVLHL